MGSPASVPDEAALALAEGLGLENKRYLVYLYARLHKTDLAAALAARILAVEPADKQTLLVLASMYIELKNVDRALFYGRRLAELFPHDEQARYYLGAAYYLAGQFALARDTWRDLKLERFEGRLYPYQSDLASATFRAGDWHRALLAYQELLRSAALTEEARLSTRQVLEGIYRLHLPQISVDSSAFLLDPGRYFQTKLEHRQHLNDANKVFVRWNREDVEVKEGPFVRRRAVDRNDLAVGLETMFNAFWTTTASIGGSEAGVVGNAGIVRTFGEQRTLKLELAGNQPSSDGLLFQSLGGRRNRLSLSGEYLLGQTWLLEGELYGWESVLPRERLGLGWGATWSVERVLIRNRPELRAGYRGVWNGFSRTSERIDLVDPAAAPGLDAAERLALLDGLLLREFHRHGLYFDWRGQVAGALSYHAGAGVDYAVDRSSMEPNAVAGLSFYPIRRLELKTETAFTSSARTADQASKLWQINVALKYWF